MKSSQSFKPVKLNITKIGNHKNWFKGVKLPYKNLLHKKKLIVEMIKLSQCSSLVLW